MTSVDVLRIGAWLAVRSTGELMGSRGTLRLEPKVAELLFVLAERAGETVSRDALLDALWPHQVVGEDSLARAVSKLRQALGDQAKAPVYIETLAKRGYRLIADVSTPSQSVEVGSKPEYERSLPDVARPPDARVPRRHRWLLLGPAAAVLVGGVALVALVKDRTPPMDNGNATLVGRADDFYFQFSRRDNEAAIALYERVLALEPDNADASAGLANALVQRALRWPQVPGQTPVEFTQLRDALAHGHLNHEPFSQQLARARQLADRALTLAPNASAAHKASGFVASAQGRFDDALESYRNAVTLDPDAWGALINTGDVLEITRRDAQALSFYEQAYAAMARGYSDTPVQVRPWHSELGVLVAQRHAARGDTSTAEVWYRRVLMETPFHPAATRGLATLLHESGNSTEAERLCDELVTRAGTTDACNQDQWR